MSIVQRSHLVPAPIAPTWAAISKMGAVADWHPNVARASMLTPNEVGVGASRRVEFHAGGSAVETVVSESEQEFVTMEMTEVPMIRNARVTIRTKARSADETEVTFSIDYGLKFGPLGWLVDTVMMKRMFPKVFGVALDGLSFHLKTGELVADSVPS